MRERAPDTNRLAIDATLATRDALRHTPAGLAAIDAVLLHRSEQPEAGGRRRVECEIAAVAFGGVAEAIAKLPVGSAVRCEGFVARRWRTGLTLALHIDRIEPLDEHN
ncbi:Primosomal replication protein N [Burkholderiales bacterium]|nr:Primosomal replication protein N [Burkholderiales bacterium]